jgi:hypothetical protein
MIVTVNTAALASEPMLAHYQGHRPYLTGMRLVLEALGIELPAPLARKSPGRKRSADPARVTLWRDRRRAMA